MNDNKRYHVLMDGVNIGSAATRENAVCLIRSYQELENHPFLKAEFCIIYGEMEYIPYKKQAKHRQQP